MAFTGPPRVWDKSGKTRKRALVLHFDQGWPSYGGRGLRQMAADARGASIRGVVPFFNCPRVGVATLVAEYDSGGML